MVLALPDYLILHHASLLLAQHVPAIIAGTCLLLKQTKFISALGHFHMMLTFPGMLFSYIFSWLALCHLDYKFYSISWVTTFLTAQLKLPIPFAEPCLVFQQSSLHVFSHLFVYCLSSITRMQVPQQPRRMSEVWGSQHVSHVNEFNYISVRRKILENSTNIHTMLILYIISMMYNSISVVKEVKKDFNKTLSLVLR